TLRLWLRRKASCDLLAAAMARRSSRGRKTCRRSDATVRTPAMATDSSERFVLLTRLADEFAERYRRGERPSLTEYVERYPHLAAEICEVFPALVEVEQVKEDHHETAGGLCAATRATTMTPSATCCRRSCRWTPAVRRSRPSATRSTRRPAGSR